ncbi:hypothetical protein GLX_01900 [Komagataeibacter medellinensis NBRC 3288]|uniref:Uncharacterized protein n=1 Tax=Komagataeibacter medellinensis (strain NBRC 3288 / BCRC 11682 / LMG 1693 / Kondo 51) TaxID=634177 RepID=G2I2Z7_KOMMN|nr:hypothetical protein GLX_01900 [Komagataeibacter medellinensis NBRC 3288]
MDAFKKNFLTILKSCTGHLPRGKRIEIWFQDEARSGQKNGVVRQGAKRGARQHYAQRLAFRGNLEGSKNR